MSLSGMECHETFGSLDFVENHRKDHFIRMVMGVCTSDSVLTLLIPFEKTRGRGVWWSRGPSVTALRMPTIQRE